MLVSLETLANYASNRLGKSPRNFTNLNLVTSKGLFDQLGYLGLNALLSASNQFGTDDFLVQNSLSNNSIVNSALVNNSLSNQSQPNSSPVNNSSINNLIASLTDSKSQQHQPPPPICNSTTSINSGLTDVVACLSPSNKLSYQQQMLLNQSFNWNNQPHLNQQSDLNTNSANHIDQQTDLVNNHHKMAKSRFETEDPVALDYNTKVSKQSAFVDDTVELTDNSSSIINQKDLTLSIKQTSDSNPMETNGENQSNKEQQNESLDNQTDSVQVKEEENDENNKNRENNQQTNKCSADESASNSTSSSRCTSPMLNDDNNDSVNNALLIANDLSKSNRVDNIVNNLVSERINSNSSSTGSERSANGQTNGNKINGNCKSKRKLNAPQQCKTTEEEDELNEINQMNEIDDKDDLYKDELDEDMDDEDSQAYSTSQPFDDLRKFSSNEFNNVKALQSLLQQFQLQQQQQQQEFDNQFKNQLNQQLNNQIHQQLSSQLNQINSNLRSTRVSDRGRMNGQMNSSNNSANSTPVNLSMNSPRPMDDDDYLLVNSRNQEFYSNDTKNDIEQQQFNNLSSNLCKEFGVLFEDLQKAICSRKLLINLQDKLRIRFEQFLNGNDPGLEQFFNNTREHLISSIVQLVETNFQRYKTKMIIQHFRCGNTNNNSNQISHQFNQSSKNMSAISLANKQRKTDIRSIPNDHHLRSNDIRSPSTNHIVKNSIVEQTAQLSNRLQRSSPNLLAGFDSNKLFQNLNLNSVNLNAANLSDFKTPLPNFTHDNLQFVQNLLAQQEELQLQKQFQKENQHDPLALLAPKRKRIKASDEPRRTRTSNRLPITSQNSMSSLISNSLNTINSINSLNPNRINAELIANLVSRELNNTPLHNLNHSTNAASLSTNGLNRNSLNEEHEQNLTHQSTNNNNNSMNSSVFPFNNSSFMNTFNQTDLDVQQLMLAAGLNNGQSNSNRASPISSFGNPSANPTPYGGILDSSPDNSLSHEIEGAETTDTLSPVHLRKAKLMFFYVRYPSSNVLKTYFRDIKFHKNNTAQLVKWFSNFREFYYQKIDKYARQELSNRCTNAEDIHIPADSELLKVLNVHYNRQNHINVPESFRTVVEQTVREFFRAIQENRDTNEASWRKPIYKIIARLDTTVPECFRSPNFLEALESNVLTDV